MEIQDSVKLLSQFEGTWDTTGIIPASEGHPEIKIKGTDSYEWLSGGFFLLHKVDVLIGEERNETTEIIGLDRISGDITMHYFDNKGNSGKMIAVFKDKVWTFKGDSLRFTGRFNEEGNMLSGVWESSEGGSAWNPFINIKLVKRNL